ncbi:hemolysin family protein [Pseudonocardia oceani]|uniref:hemolysin family protein n=1 Tax=Pseudonocardia oceani TaxID=2792013 RepID=UPI0027E2B26F|nr:hemolysin family protein [Pseudonocardia oceani]
MVIEWVLLVVALVLVAANALFVAAEFSLVTVDRSTVERATRDGDPRAEGVLAALRSLSTQLSGAQLGITVTSLLVGFLAEPSLASLIGPLLTVAGLPEATALAVSITLALVLATFVQMVFGELVPKNLAIARPLPVARAVAGPQRAFSRVAGPLLGFLNGTANRIVRLFGIEPQEELRSARAPQELESLVRRSAQEGMLAGPTAELVSRSLAFGERTAADVMTPRFQVTFLATTDTADAVLDAVDRSGYSRFPVLRGGVDSVVGTVHVKHALAVPERERGTRTVADLMVDPLPVPGSQELDPLLPLLRGQGLQMAVVVDEYGGTAGVVTLEDLIEEIVGEIADEHDPREDRAFRTGDGVWTLSGLLRPDEVGELTEVHLPEGPDFDSLGGLVVDRLGRVPQTGDAVVEEVDGRRVHLRVEAMDGWRVDRVRMVVDEEEQAGG